MYLILDWDGTVTVRDTLWMLLERFGARDVFERMEGALGATHTHREVMEAEMATITAPLEEAVAFLVAAVEIRAGFRGVVERFRPLVLSSSFHETIEPVLTREGVEVELVANRIVNRLVQLMFWVPFNDLTNAFKAYRAEVVRECGPYRASHFNITIEMSLSALVRGFSIAQVSIRWSGRTWGSSHLKIREMGRRYLCILLKVFLDKVLIADDLWAEQQAHRTQAAPRRTPPRPALPAAVAAPQKHRT